MPAALLNTGSVEEGATGQIETGVRQFHENTVPDGISRYLLQSLWERGTGTRENRVSEGEPGEGEYRGRGREREKEMGRFKKKWS